MEARAARRPALASRAPAWLLGLVPLALIATAAALFALLDAPGLGERSGPPVEEVAVERTVLRPGEIELTVRNDGPDEVRIEQVSVADAFLPFSGDEALGRLDSATLNIPYPWIEGESYEVFLLTSTGGTVEHEIPVAAETPEADTGFYGLMALLGVYVGVIPVSLGMLWLPFVRRVSAGWIRVLIAFTIGLLAFLAIDATAEGVEIASEGPQAFGGAVLVFLGALASYFALAGVDAHVQARHSKAREAGAAGAYLALLIAIGIGLHNLGEGLAIGSAYAAGALALGAFLVVGFALHNTTEGLAIVAPLAERPPGLARLAALGLIAGGPAILGAWVGAAAFNPSVAAFLLGVGAGAIVQVVRQLLPAARDPGGRSLTPANVAAMLGGLAVLYATGLLVSV
jgi:ZIP family zinc transporter